MRMKDLFAADASEFGAQSGKLKPGGQLRMPRGITFGLQALRMRPPCRNGL
jgi:hypothetical protein